MADEEQNEETPEDPGRRRRGRRRAARRRPRPQLKPRARGLTPRARTRRRRGRRRSRAAPDRSEGRAEEHARGSPQPSRGSPAAKRPCAEPTAEEKAKAKDRPPGADLEPIAIEDEKELTAEERARKEAEHEERAAAEQAATDDSGEEPAAPRKAAAVPADARIQATGKRKNAIARVVLTAGSGDIKINNRELDVYFPRAHDQSVARQSLVTAGYESSVDVKVRVHGGGVSGQAGAVRHGIARALTVIDPELRRDLKRRGLLTRDAREKERRKAGLKKARKKPQFSKR